MDILNQFKVGKLISNDPGLRNTRYIDAFSLMQAIVILNARLEDAVTFAHFGWMTIFPDLTQGESEVLTTKICRLTGKYFPRSVVCDQNLDDFCASVRSVDEWIELLAHGILRCSCQFFRGQTEKWFAILHSKHGKWVITAINRMKKLDQYKSDWNINIFKI